MLVACGKKEPAADAPLAYVPADTPYLYANLEPIAAGMAEQWSKPLQDYWPTMAVMYESMLQDPKLPALQKLKIATDGKPVALSADLLPLKIPPMSVAMSLAHHFLLAIRYSRFTICHL